LITIRQDLDAITSILYQTFEIPPFKRNYDAAFGQITAILRRYGIINEIQGIYVLDLLCVCKSFLILFLKINGGQVILLLSSNLKNLQAISKFKEWIIEQIT
jgi:hypothetical protein